MKKLLPASKGFTTFMRTERGFTLVELLIVVSVIAILAVIGLAIFTGIQSRGRDAARKANLTAISKAMETNYNETTGQYAALADTMFASGVIPKDPLNGASSCQTNVCKYCVRSSSGNCAPTDPAVATAQPPAGATYMVCANLEQGSPTYICIGSQR